MRTFSLSLLYKKGRYQNINLQKIVMRIIKKPTLVEWGSEHPDAKDELDLWYHRIKAVDWSTPNKITEKFNGVSILKNNRVCFNIKGNHYRLIVMINYRLKIVYLRWFGPHVEYDKIDANTV